MNTATNPARIESESFPVGHVTRERRYARGANGGAVNLTMSHEGGAYVTRWSVNSGRGWSKGWKSTSATETVATEFLATKWAVLVAWLEKLEPVAHGGAAEVFSMQVATMAR